MEFAALSASLPISEPVRTCMKASTQDGSRCPLIVVSMDMQDSLRLSNGPHCGPWVARNS